MPNNEPKPYEWNIFDRLDELESIAIELIDKAEKGTSEQATTVDASNQAINLATVALIIAFTSACITNPSQATSLKDICLRLLAKQNIREEIIEKLKNRIGKISELMEKRWNKS